MGPEPPKAVEEMHKEVVGEGTLLEKRVPTDKGPPPKRTRFDVRPAAPTVEERWAEVFWMLQEGGLGDKGSFYALTLASLKQQAEDLDSQTESILAAEAKLLKSAREEGDANAAAKPQQVGDAAEVVRADEDGVRAVTWGRALSRAVSQQAEEADEAGFLDDPPDAAARLTCHVQEQVRKEIDFDKKAREEADEAAAWQARQELLRQQQAREAQEAKATAESQALARVEAEAAAQAQVLVHAQTANAEAQAEAVAQAMAYQRQQAEQAEQAQAMALQQVEASHQAEVAISASDRTLLRAQGLNSKRLPLRPGMATCGFYMRRGECRYGRACKWDHPEVLMSTKGYPLRPGETQCPFYMRTGSCRFMASCKYDHPENANEAGVLAMQQTDAMIPSPESQRPPGATGPASDLEMTLQASIAAASPEQREQLAVFLAAAKSQMQSQLLSLEDLPQLQPQVQAQWQDQFQPQVQPQLHYPMQPQFQMHLQAQSQPQLPAQPQPLPSHTAMGWQEVKHVPPPA